MLPISVNSKTEHLKYNNKNMNQNIVIKKEKPICQLEGLPGVKRHEIDAYWFKDVNDIEATLELGYACTSAGDNGAINVWKDDAGIIRSELMRHCITIEKRTFASYSEAEKCVNDWLEKIN
jgi:hypothetical protein|nr:MAG TPA: hypothetical protein [Caudoviricetes sp.]